MVLINMSLLNLILVSLRDGNGYAMHHVSRLISEWKAKNFQTYNTFVLVHYKG